jgi:predicted alpha/beta-fold hydrolase
LRGAHVQSLLASLPLRRPLVTHRAGGLLDHSHSEILDCGGGVRLLAEVTPPGRPGTGRTAILIHGWEGSANSMYMLSAGGMLWQQGFRVVRLNLRDHGDSHHLNRELFHSCRLEEVAGAVRAVQRYFPRDQLYLAGFSLGGNFALRVAAAAAQSGLILHRVAAIGPVLDPRETLEALDDGPPVYRHYFIARWRRSLERKRAAFPAVYQFGELSRFRTLRAMTDYFVRHYTEFPDLEAYLQGYALTGARLSPVAVACHVLVAEDDPVVPACALERLAQPATLQLVRSRYGGHCGYLADFGLRSWADDFIASAFAS